jgi:hypothetical protein
VLSKPSADSFAVGRRQKAQKSFLHSLTICDKVASGNKKINVLRKCIYDAAHARVIPRWEQVVKNIDRLYVLEYVIGEKSGRVHTVLKEWVLWKTERKK